jgi:hypothetical protein
MFYEENFLQSEQQFSILKVRSCEDFLFISSIVIQGLLDEILHAIDR